MPLHPHPDPNLADIARDSPSDGLFAGFCYRHLPKGYLLSTPDRTTDNVFIVCSGRLKVYLAGENRELSLGYLEAGDVYATHSPVYVRTVAPSNLWIGDTETFARQLIDHPELTRIMMGVVGRLLTDTLSLVEDLAFREVPARLARFFIGLAKRRGQMVDDGWLIPLDLGMQDIGELLGATRQTISGLINAWEREGLLHRRARGIYLVPSLNKLAERFPEAA